MTMKKSSSTSTAKKPKTIPSKQLADFPTPDAKG
jgi:hypothetical protein